MNILVTGAGGQLGSELRLAARGREDRFVFSDIVRGEGILPLDVTNPSAVREFVIREKIGAVINCAAYTNVEGAEDDADAAKSLNAVAPGILAGAMKEAGGLMVHISTDYVFGGDMVNTPIGEDFPPSPLNVYGRTKLLGEQAVVSSGCRYLIVRTAWLYSSFGKNFVKTMLGLMASRPFVKVVCDQAGTPTYAADLAGAILQIIGMLPSGRGSDIAGKGESDTPATPAGCVLNYTGEGVCSWYDFAKMIAEYSGNTSCEVLPCHSGEFPSKVRRPSYSVLDKTRIKQTFGLAVPHWTDSLKRCLEKMGKLKT